MYITPLVDLILVLIFYGRALFVNGLKKMVTIDRASCRSSAIGIE